MHRSAFLALALVPVPPATHAFIGVNVRPMDSDRVLGAHTVVVEGRTIVAVGPDGRVTVPSGAVVHQGGFLMPGLVDAHSHERPLPDWPGDAAGNFAMSLANSVTTLVNMGDFSGALPALRAAVRAGQIAGREIYIGHFVRGPSDGGTSDTIVTGAESARALLQRVRAGAADFFKVYDGVPASACDVLAAGRYYPREALEAALAELRSR